MLAYCKSVYTGSIPVPASKQNPSELKLKQPLGRPGYRRPFTVVKRSLRYFSVTVCDRIVTERANPS